MNEALPELPPGHIDRERMEQALSGPSFAMPPGLTREQRAAFFHVVAQATSAERERCARIAEHLNGWGSPPAPELADHIAKVIRATPPPR